MKCPANDNVHAIDDTSNKHGQVVQKSRHNKGKSTTNQF